MSDKLHDKIYQINCLTEEVDSLYHQAALKLGVSDSVMFVLYMLHIGGEKCLLYDIYKLSGISKQTINSAIRKLENDGIVYLEKHNGKSKIVCVTEKGKAYIAQTGARLAEADCATLETASSHWIPELVGACISTALFVSGAQMILKFGIATVALTGSILLAKGEIDVLTFFLFLLLVSRLYDPMQISLQNLAAIISADVQCKRIDEILSHDIQTGTDQLTNKGYDIEFNHVGFAYNDREAVL